MSTGHTMTMTVTSISPTTTAHAPSPPTSPSQHVSSSAFDWICLTCTNINTNGVLSPKVHLTARCAYCLPESRLMRMLLNRDDEMMYKNTNTAGCGNTSTARMGALPRRPTGLKEEEVKRGFVRRHTMLKEKDMGRDGDVTRRVLRRSTVREGEEVKREVLRRGSTMSIRGAVKRVGSWKRVWGAGK